MTGEARYRSWMVRLYRLALRALPGSVREQKGEEMLGTFSSLVEHRGADATLPQQVLFTVAECADVVTAGSGARLRGAMGGSGRGPRRITTLMAESLHQAVRHLRARLGFSVMFVLTFALGIGLNAGLFSVVNAVALKPLPYESPERIVQVWAVNDETGRDRPFVTAEEFFSWSQFDDVFESTAAWNGSGPLVLTGGDSPERISGLSVTVDLFKFLGVGPVQGRDFEVGDGLVGGPPLVIISEELRARRFPSGESPLGELLVFDDVSHTVVGVMSEGFRFPYGETDAWFPIAREPSVLNTVSGISAVARLRPGIAMAEAENILAARVREAGDGATDRPYLTDLEFMETNKNTKKGMILLLGAVFMVLLIGIANVLSLSFADLLQRGREFSVRKALGASTGRIFVHLSAEAFILSLVSAFLGLLIAQGVLFTLIPRLPSELGINTGGRPLDLWPDGVMFGVVIVLIATPVLAGLRTAYVTRMVGAQVGARGETVGRIRMQRWLVISEVALALVLMSGAGLMANSFLRLAAIDPGVSADELLIAEVGLGSAYVSPQERQIRYREFADRLRLVEGVTAVSYTTSSLPDASARFRPTIEGLAGETVKIDGFLPYHQVEPAFFTTLGIDITSGRALQAVDAGANRAVIGELLAERIWPGRSAVGQQFRVRENEPWMTVVGVAEDVPQMGPRDGWGEGMEYYTLIPEDDRMRIVTYAVRSERSPETLINPVRAAIWEVDPNQPFGSIGPFTDAYNAKVNKDQFYLMLFLLIAGVAMSLTGVGIHGLLSQFFGQRRRELGIRMALGADRKRMLGEVARLGMVLVTIGGVLGLALTLGMGRSLQSLLYEVKPSDPPTLAGGILFLLLIGLVASIGPARRVIRMDPADVLRDD